ncbi:RING-type domain-containing protein [Psidium guajava]|nr:RING-type domain-containing protein [Psidium guajava]
MNLPKVRGCGSFHSTRNSPFSRTWEFEGKPAMSLLCFTGEIANLEMETFVTARFQNQRKKLPQPSPPSSPTTMEDRAKGRE